MLWLDSLAEEQLHLKVGLMLDALCFCLVALQLK